MDASRPRRSSRLSAHTRQHSQPSAFGLAQPSQSCSTSSSSYPSPTNDSTQPPSAQLKSHFPPHLQPPPLSTSFSQKAMGGGPLPSPSAGDVNPFYCRPHSQPTISSQPQHFGQAPFLPQDHNQHALGYNQQYTTGQHHPSFSQPGGNPAQSPFGGYAQDFRILEEAAKRAQMACLERDLGEVEL